MIDNKLRITAGNTFATAHTITAQDVLGQPIPDFDLQNCTDIQVYARNGGSYKQVTSWQLDDQSVVVMWYGKQMRLGGYDFYIAGKFGGADWRTSEATIFEIVQYNEEANIPADTIVVDGTYFLDASFSLITEIQGGGGGATPSDDLPLMDGTADAGTSAKYSRGDHVHQSDTSKQDVISDLSTIRSGAAAGATALQPSALTGYATETYVGNAVSGEATRAETAEGLLQDAIDAIEAVIPNAATSSNQLADKDFVNHSIATNTATFKGTYNSLAELQQVTATNNDYAFVIETDAVGNEYYDRYKYNGSQWIFEYKVESTPFTAAQWAAIQSGITSALVTKIGTALQPTDIIDSLNSASTTSALSANQGKVLNDGKQDKIDATHKLSADLVDDTSTTNKFVTTTEKGTWNGKQDALVSGTNIKTINNESLLGSGNINIQGGGGGGEENVIEVVKVNGTALTPDANKAVDISVPVVSTDVFEDKTSNTKASSPKSVYDYVLNYFMTYAETSVLPYATRYSLSTINSETGAIASSTSTAYVDEYNIPEGVVAVLVSGRQGATTNRCMVAIFNGTTYIAHYLDNDGTGRNIVDYPITLPPGATMIRVAGSTSNQAAVVKTRIAGLREGAARNLNVLAIGNSYTYDAFGYLPKIVKDNLPYVNLSIGVLYQGHCSLAEHLDNISNNTPYPQYAKYYAEHEQWTTLSDSVSAADALLEKRWDIIILQQNSANSEDYTTYQPYLNQIINTLAEMVTYPVKFGWLLTPAWADGYSSLSGTSDDMYDNIAANAQKVLDETLVEFVIPVGTAIQNARHTSLDSLGTFGHLTYDGTHLNEGIPCLIEAYTSLLSMVKVSGNPYRSVIGEQTRPTDSWITGQNIPQAHGTSVGVNDANSIIAQKCAIWADKNPFEISTI